MVICCANRGRSQLQGADTAAPSFLSASLLAEVCSRRCQVASMSEMTYTRERTGPNEKPLVWLSGEVKTPSFSKSARLECGFLLRRVQHGQFLALPWSRPMPLVGRRCHELRIQDGALTWRIICRIDPDAIIVVDVFAKKQRATPRWVITRCKKRLQRYDGA
jgi:phage-related protein